ADINVLTKINYAHGKSVDGHTPGITGKNLSAYIAAGIHSDHESVSLDEAKDKLRQGMYVMIREGSSEKNLDALLALVTDKTYKRCIFVVDDRSCVDLLRDGDIDAILRKAINKGLDPVRAIQMATINNAEYFRLDKLGAIAPGYIANLVTFNDFTSLQMDMVFYKGRLVAKQGQPLFSLGKSNQGELTNTVNIKPFSIETLRIPASGEKQQPIIELIPGQIITKKKIAKLKVSDGIVISDIDRDILKLVVMERHNATGNIGLGLVHGFGLKKGALAASITHDSHNIIAIGTNDIDIFAAIKEIERLQGGLVVTNKGKVLAALELSVCGLMSDESLEIVVSKLENLQRIAKDLGTTLLSPFATLSFLALPVIPEIRLTDLGMVDVNEFKLI
ncbi:MAG: adenine deaminase C-terminal domain-containing protein, partial [Dehalococcoidales bacterium]|nr:adenine deaminase C-terminal domain-containing protein [Dehalococcoidales bacterium]